MCKDGGGEGEGEGEVEKDGESGVDSNREGGTKPVGG